VATFRLSRLAVPPLSQGGEGKRISGVGAIIENLYALRGGGGLVIRGITPRLSDGLQGGRNPPALVVYGQREGQGAAAPIVKSRLFSAGYAQAGVWQIICLCPLW